VKSKKKKEKKKRKKLYVFGARNYYENVDVTICQCLMNFFLIYDVAAN